MNRGHFNQQIKLFILLFLLLRLHYTPGTQVKLLEYSQSNSETNCSSGLIHNVDLAVFKCEVENDELNQSYYLKFQVREIDDDDFKTWIDVYQGRNNSGNTTYYIEYSKDNVMIITVKKLATRDFDLAFLRVIMNNKNYSQAMGEARFPVIKESTDVELTIVITEVNNNQSIEGCGNSSFNNDINIHYVCISKVKPCLIDIKINEIQKFVFKESGYVFLGGSQKETNITARYATCRLDGNVKLFTCTFRFVLKQDVRDNDRIPTTLIILIFLTLLLIFSIVLLCLLSRGLANRMKRKLATNQAQAYCSIPKEEYPPGSSVFTLKLVNDDGEYRTVGELKKLFLKKLLEKEKPTPLKVT